MFLHLLKSKIKIINSNKSYFMRKDELNFYIKNNKNIMNSIF